GSKAATANPRKIPSGWSPRRSASLESMITHAEAPSESWLALPAVMWPLSPVTGLRAATPSPGGAGRVPPPPPPPPPPSPPPLVPVQGARLFADVVGRLVLDQLGGRERDDLGVQAPLPLGGRGALLAGQRVLVLPLAGDEVASRDHLGGLDHRHVDLWLVLVQPPLAQPELVLVLV